MTAPPGHTGALGPDERAELDRLRADVARLRAAAGGRATPPAVPRPGWPRRWGRTAVAAVLIMIACVFAPFSVVAVWARGEVGDTDRYVNTVAPLASDPAVQQAITADITDLVFRYVDVQGLTRQTFAALAGAGSLPPRLAESLQALAVPVANGVRSFTQDQVRKVVQSDLFAKAWVDANRTAHEQLVTALSGQTGGGVVVEDNAVKLDIAAFLTVVKQRLVASGFQLASRIPEVNATFTIFESADVGKVQRGYKLLDKAGLWLPFVLVGMAGLGIYAARDHRRAFIATGAGVALTMLAAAIALALARRAYLDGVPPGILPRDAAATVLDTVVRYLREAVRAAFLIGLLVAAGGFLTGPSVTAVTIRRWLARGFVQARRGMAALNLRLEAAADWTAPRARVLRALVLAAALVVLLLRRYRTPTLVLWLTVAVLGCVAVVQLLATRPPPAG
ncbi:MAG: hypothetical protein V7637_2488 [Mycobacteriales bacterium]